jgi:hypothetical protein
MGLSEWEQKVKKGVIPMGMKDDLIQPKVRLTVLI